MPSYRRFVTYLFQYENMVKVRNCGFAKVEIRQGQCRMELQVRGVPEGNIKVYLFTKKEKGFLGIFIGEFTTGSGNGAKSFVFATNPVENTEYSMEDMCGIYLEEEGECFAASQWEDEELDWKSFRVYQREEAIPEDDSEMPPEIHVTQMAAPDRDAVPVKEKPVSSYIDVWDKQWERFSSLHPVFCPFDETQDVFAVKIDLRDFKILPKRFLPLANNSFLLHGYFNYKYLLFGYMDGESKKWFLGVPGVFQNQEQLLAGLFGFEGFRTKHVTKQKTGEFGYWYRYL